MKTRIVTIFLTSAFIALPSLWNGSDMGLLFAYKSTYNSGNNGNGNGGSGKKPADPPSVMAGCSPATSKKDLDINNVKAMIHSGGDMWWDLVGAARYEIPKNSGKMALFAGSLWLGGKDVSGQLKIAALRFRQVGNDFWTGPLSTKTAEISPETCIQWDKHFVTTRDEVSQFNAWYQAGLDDAANGTTTQQDNFENYQIPQSILNWPAHGRNYEPFNEDFYLAPFFDKDNDGVYNPLSGDYPAYDFSSTPACSRGKIDKIYGDQNLWWIFNDKGNVHTETGAASIGMEIRAQAFAFATSDEVNNMTFYNYEMYNRSTYTLTETYFGQWVDVDLGGYQDDYVGCDVQRGLGYGYNGDETDEDFGGAKGYGSQPPAIGVDFFQGPYQDNDDSDNPLYTATDPIKIMKIEFLDGPAVQDSLKITTSNNHNLQSTDLIFSVMDITDGIVTVNSTSGLKDGDMIVMSGTSIDGQYYVSSVTPTTFSLVGYSASPADDLGTALLNTVNDLIKISGNMPSVTDTNLLKYMADYKKVKVRRISETQFVFWVLSTSTPNTLSNYGLYVNPGTDNVALNQLGLKEIQDQLGIPYKGIGIGYGDGIKDNERFGMRKFLYHNNNSSNTGDPESGVQYYNYLRAYWKNGSRMTYGGNGNSGVIPADYMFPDDSDPLGWGNYYGDGAVGNVQPDWNEVTAGNSPYDRRFMQSAGPFTLGPGAINNITVGVVWAQAPSGGRWESVQAVRKADDKTQAMFDNCFQVLNGPDAPELSFRELDKQLIVYITNKPISNNYNERYSEKDIFLGDPDWIDTNNDGVKDYQLSEQEKAEFGQYKFQGYLVYQVKDKSVSSGDLKNPEKARLVFQCDIKDSISKIVNKYYSAEIGADVPVLEVEGADKGVVHSFAITEDKFATGDKRLVNHKKVYFLAIAYGYNYSPFNAFLPEIEKQKKPFIGSRKAATGGIKVFTAIPHKTEMEINGNIPNSNYGDEMELTRLEGAGNGGRAIFMKKESLEEAVSGRVNHIVYERGFGPLSVKIVDPLNVPNADFSILLFDSVSHPTYVDLDERKDSSGYWWFIWEKDKWSEGKQSTSSINIENEELLLEWGISVTIKQVSYPRPIRQSSEYANDYLGAQIIFDDPAKSWLTGVPDADGFSPQNWIRSGSSITATDEPDTPFDETLFDDRHYLVSTGPGQTENVFIDDNQVYEKILGGTWSPYILCSQDPHGPVPSPTNGFFDNNATATQPITGNFQMKYLYSVDIVFTADKSKWTRCPVLEMQTEADLSQGIIFDGAAAYPPNIPLPQPSKKIKGFIRSAPSVDKNGNKYDTTGFALKGWKVDSLPKSTNPNDANFVSGIGMGWFPGYAVNVETGERLNMAFGEDTWLGAENGRDMLWNPTSNIFEGPFEDVRFGGKHYIFVFRNNVVEDTASIPYPSARMPAYQGDYGKFMFDQLKKLKNFSNSTPEARNVWRAAMWVGLPLLEKGQTLLSTDATVSIRVSRPFENYGTGTFLSKGDPLTIGEYYFVDKGPVVHSGITYTRGQCFMAYNDSFSIDALNIQNGDTVNNLVFNPLKSSSNGGRPVYSFSTRDYATDTNKADVLEDALKLINVVPNPYYAYSEYETDKVDNRIKIINLPQKCNISIYTTNGNLVRKLTKDDPTISSLEWDLKNSVRIPIASGMYIIHVEVPDVGERTLKWMGIMRPVDLDSY